MAKRKRTTLDYKIDAINRRIIEFEKAGISTAKFRRAREKAQMANLYMRKGSREKLVPDFDITGTGTKGKSFRIRKSNITAENIEKLDDIMKLLNLSSERKRSGLTDEDFREREYVRKEIDELKAGTGFTEIYNLANVGMEAQRLDAWLHEKGPSKKKHSYEEIRSMIENYKAQLPRLRALKQAGMDDLDENGEADFE